MRIRSDGGVVSPRRRALGGGCCNATPREAICSYETEDDGRFGRRRAVFATIFRQWVAWVTPELRGWYGRSPGGRVRRATAVSSARGDSFSWSLKLRRRDRAVSTGATATPITKGRHARRGFFHAARWPGTPDTPLPVFAVAPGAFVLNAGRPGGLDSRERSYGVMLSDDHPGRGVSQPGRNHDTRETRLAPARLARRTDPSARRTVAGEQHKVGDPTRPVPHGRRRRGRSRTGDDSRCRGDGSRAGW